MIDRLARQYSVLLCLGLAAGTVGLCRAEPVGVFSAHGDIGVVDVPGSVVYDAEKDIAKVTAIVSLPSIENIDGEVLDLQGKIFRRVAFATSTPTQAGPLKALRAAELDAYKQLVKEIVGFTLESQTTVENYMLKSDTVKTKVLATMYMAQVTEFGWDDEGNAFVKMALNSSEISQMIGEQVTGEPEVIEVEGMGAQQDDFSQAQKQ